MLNGVHKHILIGQDKRGVRYFIVGRLGKPLGHHRHLPTHGGRCHHGYLPVRIVEVVTGFKIVGLGKLNNKPAQKTAGLVHRVVNVRLVEIPKEQRFILRLEHAEHAFLTAGDGVETDKKHLFKRQFKVGRADDVGSPAIDLPVANALMLT